MYSDEDYRYFVKNLTSNNLKDREYTVRHLATTDVVGDARLLPLLEPLLQDQRITITGGMPPIYCEVRWLAAKAIDTQRRLLKLPLQKISRLGFLFPCSYGMMVVFAEEQHGIKDTDIPRFSSDSEEPYPLKKLKYLQKLGVLPVCTNDESPYLDYSTLPRSRY